ncbi:MAG: hypothetical protein RI897_2618 [Verrucomicrobiota bacterium]|jgi:hypothetical protein
MTKKWPTLFFLFALALLIGTVWLRLSPHQSPIGVGVDGESKRAESVGISNAVALDSSPSSATSPAGIGLLSTGDTVDEVSPLSPSDEVRARKLADGYTLRTNLLAEPYTGIVSQTLIWTPTGRVTVLETGIVDDRVYWTVGGDVIRRHNEEAREKLAEEGVLQDVAKREKELRRKVADVDRDEQYREVVKIMGEPQRCEVGIRSESGEIVWSRSTLEDLASVDFAELRLYYTPYKETNRVDPQDFPFQSLIMDFGEDGRLFDKIWYQ